MGKTVEGLINASAELFGPPPDPDVYAAARDLGNGKRAVKTVDPAGKVRYAIWDAKERPVEDAATSLAELLSRFP